MHPVLLFNTFMEIIIQVFGFIHCECGTLKSTFSVVCWKLGKGTRSISTQEIPVKIES